MMISRMACHRRSLAIGLILAAISGCGGEDNPKTVRVSGTLLVDGKPVGQGAVHFHPAKGRPASGFVKDGKFTLSTFGDGDGVIPGKNRVAVEVGEEVPTRDGDTTTRSLIAPQFGNPDRSGVQLEIPEAGYSNLQIDIRGANATIKEG